MWSDAKRHRISSKFNTKNFVQGVVPIKAKTKLVLSILPWTQSDITCHDPPIGDQLRKILWRCWSCRWSTSRRVWFRSGVRGHVYKANCTRGKLKHVSEHMQIRCSNNLKRRADGQRFCCDNCRYVIPWVGQLCVHTKGKFDASCEKPLRIEISLRSVQKGVPKTAAWS